MRKGKSTADGLTRAAAEGRLVEFRTHVPDPPPPPDGCSEAVFQKHVIDLARSRGWRVAHFRKVRVQRKDGRTYFETPVAADGKGFLDLELVRDRIVKMELKVGHNKPTPEQLEWAAAYERAGVEHYFFWPKHWGEIVRVLS